jgi:hypothetical protein
MARTQLRSITAVTATLLTALGCGSSPSSGTQDASHGDGAIGGDAPIGATGLHVEGNHLVDQGKTVRLLGVNHAGSEWACIGANGTNGYGFFDGPSDMTLITPMLAWHVNAVRIPLNQDCWQGTKPGLNAAYTGKKYRDAITALVTLLRANHLYVILDLHWSAPAPAYAISQQPMAAADAVEFWGGDPATNPTSVASTFKGDLGVVFDVFNEPYLEAKFTGSTDPYDCLLHGCTSKTADASHNPLTTTYATAGVQAMVDAIRAAGAHNVVLVPGLAYTNDLTHWAANRPTDPTGNLAASLHLYSFNGCSPDYALPETAACWDAHYAPIAASYPLVTGENGESDCAHGFVDAYFTWADAHGVSYLGWAWNAQDCSGFPALISSYDGTPTAFGAGYKAHLLTVN